MGDSSKVQRQLGRDELPAFFRELADALESGGEGELACLAEFRKLKISVREEFEQYSLKMKVKPATCEEPGAEPDGPDAKPRYKTLKKRMKSSFRIIYKTIHEGQMPPEPALASFLDDSVLMVSYPGYGDEYYEDYTRAVGELKKAAEAGDMQAMLAAVDELAAQKGRCHAKYD